MRTFFDSSAFAKRYLQEKGSTEVEATCLAADAVGLAVVCLPEVVSAFSRQLRESAVSETDYLAMKGRLLAEIRDAEILDLTPAVVDRAILLLETTDLRASDALNVACALEWAADLFVSSDRRQLRAAAKAGLSTRCI